MTQNARWTVFALAGAIGYVVAYTFNWPVFAYYPLVNEFHLARALPAKSFGPSMLYYGWIVTAATAAAVLALAVPRSIAAKIPPSLGWIVPVVLMVYTVIYDRHWFL